MDLGRWEDSARERLGAEAFAFLSSGADLGITALENVEAWRALRLRPLAMVDVSAVTSMTTLLGSSFDAPIGIAPMGFQKLVHPEGEAEMARGAAAAGVPLMVSTRCTTRFEDISSALGGTPWWFQVYVLHDRDITRGLVDRAVAAGCGALVVTADTPVVATKPPAAGGFHLDVRMENLDGLVAAGAGRRDFAGLEQDPSATWDVVAELRQCGLPVVVKGILRGDDARRCVDAGAAAIVVSNHGGRQLDSAVPSARALPEVVDAVGGSAEVYVDGGIRSGIDVLKALALGARAAFVGRPALWGLAVRGAGGVETVMAGLAAELREAMMLAGTPDPASIGRDLLDA